MCKVHGSPGGPRSAPGTCPPMPSLSRFSQSAAVSPPQYAQAGRPVVPGEHLAHFTLETLRGDVVAVPNAADRFVHLHFRRFAGCPICITHLRELAAHRSALEAAGIRVVVFFHSSAGEVDRHQGHLPFALVADPGMTWYRRFGVQRSPWAFLHPRALWAAVRSAVRGKGGFRVENGRLGLPADILVDGRGRVVAAKYGAHAFDQWSAADVLAAAATARAASPDCD